MAERAERGYQDFTEQAAGSLQNLTERLHLQENWRQWAMWGAFAAAAYLLVTNRRPAGFAAAGVGLAVLAAEHPQKFEEAWNRAPEYLEKGQRMIQGVGRIIDQVSEQAGKFQQQRGGRMREDYLS